MTKSPAEAAQTLCPQMLQLIGSDDPTPDCYCRGVQCMAWRWTPDDNSGAQLRRRGYCGLAGRPDERA